MDLDEDQLIHRAHHAYGRYCQRLKREGYLCDTPSYSRTEVQYRDRQRPLVVIRNGLRVLAEYRWTGERMVKVS